MTDSRSSSPGLPLVGVPPLAVMGLAGAATMFGPLAIHPPSGFVGMLALRKWKTIRFDVQARGEAKPLTIDTVSGPQWGRVSHLCFASPAAAVLDVTFCPEGKPTDLRQFDRQFSGTVHGQPFPAKVPCVAVADTAGK